MTLSFNEFSINTEALELQVAGHVVAIDERNIALLQTLAQHYPEHCSKQECLALIWPETIVSDMSLSKLVSDTRKLFNQAGYSGPLIQTVHGRGYRLDHALGKQLQAYDAVKANQFETHIEHSTHTPYTPQQGVPQSTSSQLLNSPSRSGENQLNQGDNLQSARSMSVTRQPSWWEIFAKVLIALVLVLGLMFQLWQGGSLNVEPQRQLTYSEPQGAIGRILWIDDHPENNLVEKAYFEQRNIGVYNTVTSEEALMLLTMYNYQAVISDMGRHGDPLAGLKLLQSMRENGHPTPFYLYTYVESAGLVDAIYESGGQAVIVDSESLYQLVLSHFVSDES